MGQEAAADTVVLIHGLWMTPLSWEHWVARYEQRGLKVITPGYPGIGQGEAGVAALRNDPSPLAALGVREVFDHLAEVIDALESKPIIMGHSFGGAFVQLLPRCRLRRGRGIHRRRGRERGEGASVQLRGDHGIQAVPRTQPLHLRRGRLGRGRRLCAGLGTRPHARRSRPRLTTPSPRTVA
jgi:predicted alpha/beta hydrolase